MMFDAIEKKSLKQEIKKDLVKEIFQGKSENYLKCLNVDYESKRE